MCAFPRVRIVSGGPSGPVAEGGLWRARGNRTDAAEGGKRQTDTDAQERQRRLWCHPFLRSLGAGAGALQESLGAVGRSACHLATCHLPPWPHVLFPREYERVLSYSSAVCIQAGVDVLLRMYAHSMCPRGIPIPPRHVLIRSTYSATLHIMNHPASFPPASTPVLLEEVAQQIMV